MQKLPQWVAEQKGQGVLTAVISALVVASVMFMVGIFAVANVANSIDTDTLTTAQNTTFQNVLTTTLNSFDLGVVGLIVLAASGIITILLASLRA